LALSSDGVAKVPDGDEVDFGPRGTETGLTIEFWIKHDGTSAEDAYLVNKGSQGKGYLVRLTGAGNHPRIAFSIGTPNAFSGIEEINLTSTESIPAHQWVHVAVTSNPTGDLSIFIDGQLDNNTEWNKAVGGNDEDLYIGSNQGTGSFLSGQMDDVRIWKTNRFSFQIENNYLQELSDPGSASDLVAYYPFDSQNNGQTPDLGGSSNNAMDLLGASALQTPGAVPTPPYSFAKATTDVVTSTSEATVTWEPRVGSDGDNETSEYRIYRSDAPDFPSSSTTQIGTISDGSTTFTDQSASTGSPSYYAVSAVVDGTESGLHRAAVARPGATGNSTLDLAGTSGFAEADIQPTFANSDLGSGTFTIEFWVKHDGNSDDGAYLVNKGSGGQGYLIRFDGSGDAPRIAVGIGTNNARSDVTEINLTSNQGIPANRWTHVAVANDTQGALSIFINGELDASIAEEYSVGDTESPLRLGTNSDASSNYFSGQMDNLRFWTTVRTEAEIQSSLQTLSGSEGSLAASFYFHENSGTVTRSSAREFSTISFTGDAGFTDANRAGIIYTIENAGVSADGSEYTFDVHAVGEAAGRRLGTSSVVLDYNAAGFGENVASNGAITVTRKGLLDKQVDGSDVYSDATTTDLSENRVQITHDYLTPGTPSDAAEVPGPSSGSTALFEVTMQIDDPTETAGLSLVGSAMRIGTVQGDNQTIFPEVRATDSDDSELPVEMAGFDARVDDGAVQLSWQTASETNNAGFRIQRRAGEGANGREGAWTTVGSVEGSGTTSQAQSYRFTDADLPYEADALTYRLKQIDTDGTEHFTGEVTVERGVQELELLGTYPNPARSQATVRYALPEKQEATIRLYDVLGRQVRTVVSGEQEGRHEQRLDTSSLPSGVYFLRLRAGGETRTQKLTVVQ
jgi:hypothetical protein